MGDYLNKLTSSVPAPLQSLVQQVAPQLQTMAKEALPSFPSFGSSSNDTGRVDPASEAARLGMSLDQYNNLSFEELNRLGSVNGSSSPGFFSGVGDSISNFFSGDPTSNLRDSQGDYEASQAANLANLRSGQEGYEDSLKPGMMSNIGNVFGAGLKKLATPQYLSAGANIAASLYGQNQAQKGVDQQLSAYDQALAKVQDAQLMSGESANAISDSPEQLALRSQAMKGLSDRASMGLTPEDQAALQGINRQSAQQFKANNATIGQDMQRRGMANSGLGLAQSMGAADQALQNQALAGQNQAAQSFAAKQGALNNLASASNTALNSDFNRQLGKAGNIDAVNRFNAQQKQQANTAAATNMVGKGGIQADAAANKGRATGTIGQVVGGVLNPQQEAAKKQTITIG
jgi:hypothetical protein